MKFGKIVFIGVCFVILALSFGYRQGVAAGEKQIAPAKVAVVDVTKILMNSKKHKAWQEKFDEQSTQMKAEFQKDKKALESIQANMEVFKPGTVDYVNTMKEFLDKKGLLEAKDKFYQEKVNMEMLQWTESLYFKMLDITKQIAQKKGVDLVLSQEQVETSSPSLRDFMLNIRVKKVLYSADQIDITDEVLAALDEAK
jgi:Skp family chaperone for outer membrane proteins